MSIFTEKADFPNVSVQEQERIDVKKDKVLTSAALEAATNGTKPPAFSPGMLRLWAIVSIGYFVSTMNGYDGSLMVSILES
jgi:hypothetical protein